MPDITVSSTIDSFLTETLDAGQKTTIRNSIGASPIASPTFTGTVTADKLVAYGSGGITSNTAIGLTSLNANTTGTLNTAFGNGSLQINTTGNNNTAIGADSLSNNTSYSNTTGIGYSTRVTGSDQVQLGNSSTTTYTYGTVQNRSDIRDKADVRDTALGLDFINGLRPVDFKWDMRDDYRPIKPAAVLKPEDISKSATKKEKKEYAEQLAAYNSYLISNDQWLEASKLANITHDGTYKRSRFHHGLIAQEVKTLIAETGIDFGGYQDHSVKDGDDVLSIGYEELIGPMIKAIQQLSAKIDALESIKH